MKRIYQKRLSFCKNASVGRIGGFTLIELLVVVLIIGILSAVALPQYQVAVSKSRFVQLQISAGAIEQAEQLYYMANGTYTSKFSDLDFGPQGTFVTEGFVKFGNGVTCHIFNDTLHEYNCYFPANASVPMLLKGFSGKNFYCRVYHQNKTAEKVCLSAGGVLSGSCSSEGWCHYKLP